MKKRQIGKSSLYTAPLAFGGNVFGWTIDEKQSFKLLDEFVGEGYNLIDTADVYARWAGKGGESETIIGRWLTARNNRDKVIIATKAGMDMGEGPGLKKNYIIKAIERSLQRLQTGHVDLYQSHKDDAGTAVEETLEAYDILIKTGKVRYIGASNFSAERLTQSLAASAEKNIPRYECLQPHYNLCERSIFEKELEGLCRKENLGVIPYYSLAAGFLTGKYRNETDSSKSVRGKGALKYLNARGLRILAALDEISGKHNCTQAAVSIAWLLANPVVTAPIASATTVEQLRELMAGATLELSEQEKKSLDAASAI